MAHEDCEFHLGSFVDIRSWIPRTSGPVQHGQDTFTAKLPKACMSSNESCICRIALVAAAYIGNDEWHKIALKITPSSRQARVRPSATN